MGLDVTSLGLVLLPLLSLAALCACAPAPPPADPDPQPPFRVQRDVPVPMRDGTILRADVWLPDRERRPGADAPQAERHPVLVCRTPYGKDTDQEELRFARRATARGYAVVIQDVRGRYASDGDFEPHEHEGLDGYDTIEWAARQQWCDGRVGSFGLSYPGCAQWLAALEQPPHLLAMAPAMSYSRLRDCVYYGGVLDADWVRWAWISMAPDTRRKKGLPGPITGDEAYALWLRHGTDDLQGRLPLSDFPELAQAAPFYARWTARPQWSHAWDYADIAGRYGQVKAVVLNIDGWHDDAYGPAGAVENHRGMVAAGGGSMLVLGPWSHGINSITGAERHGTRDFGPEAFIDYDALVLDFMDLHLRGAKNHLANAAPVRFFSMGENAWREAASWPPPPRGELSLNLDGGPRGTVMGTLRRSPPTRAIASHFTNDPALPVRELPDWAMGPMDQRSLLEYKGNLLVFQSTPLKEDLRVAGTIRAELYVSCDAPDVDLYAKVYDVTEDGTSYPLADASAEVLRVSAADALAGRAQGPHFLAQGEIRRVELSRLLTANTFKKGHRIRLILCASWFPGMARNLQSGESEFGSARMRPAVITLHHGPGHPSRLTLPLI